MFYRPAIRQPEMQNEIIRNNHYETSIDLTAELIKNRLLWTYNSDILNKREKIVSLLIQLERFEDTDIFFEKYGYVREYIFDST